jgi:hypothetical protein
MLVHHPDTSGNSIVRSPKVNNFIFDDNMTAIRPVHAEQNVDKRTFARTILAEESKNSSRPETYGDIIVSQNTRELFPNFARTKKSVRHAQPFS